MSRHSAEPATYPVPLVFADEADVDRFVTTLARFESGEMTPDEWRAFRLVNGTYGQRQEGDLSMLRAKIPQGVIGPVQLEAVATVADRWSRGWAHVTTRQNFQLHFIPLGSVGEAMRLLAESGITTREACGNAVRNVTCGPTAGVAADELFDPTPYAEALTRYFLRHRLSSTLPRKFKIAFAGGGSDHAFAPVNDIGWHARIEDGKRGFLVTVAGGTATKCKSGQTLFEFLPASKMLSLTEAILVVFDRLGDRVHRNKNRMKFLVAQIGWDRFREEVLTELAKIDVPLPFDPEAPRAEEVPPSGRRPRPTHAELRSLSRTETRGPGLHPRSLQNASDTQRWILTNTNKQKQGGYATATITLPLGDITSGQLRAVGQLAQAFGDGLLRLTPSQNFVLRWVAETDLGALHESLEVIGLAQPDAYSLADVVSCPGAESCKLAVTQSRGVARLVSEHFADRPSLPDLPVHVSGCPNGCGLHHIAGIGLQGALTKIDGRAAPRYFVYAGGTVGTEARFGRVVAKVLARRVPEAIERLLAIASEHAQAGEKVADTLARLDPKSLKARFADLENAPASEEDFIDLGETKPFVSIDDDAQGECA